MPRLSSLNRSLDASLFESLFSDESLRIGYLVRCCKSVGLQSCGTSRTLCAGTRTSPTAYRHNQALRGLPLDSGTTPTVIAALDVLRFIAAKRPQVELAGIPKTTVVCFVASQDFEPGISRELSRYWIV